jgi:hypothetical protein
MPEGRTPFGPTIPFKEVSMSNRQYVSPLVIRGRGADEKVTKLHRISHDEHKRDEIWFQEKLFQHPELLPAAEIEPAFHGLKAVAKELPVGPNSADLLFINPDGCIALVETKLFRNPEAKREVIAQVIDYASELSGWTYEQFVQAIKRANKSTAEDPLIEIMRESAKDARFDERGFKQRVNANLRLGQILLLIVGDDIRDEAQRMAEFIHRTPHLHFTLGLIEIALFREEGDDTGSLLVQPRVFALTRLDIRAVIKFELADGIQSRSEGGPVKPVNVDTSSISSERFFDELGKVSPIAVDLVKWAIAEAPEHQLEVDWKATGPMLKYRHEFGRAFNLGQLTKGGQFSPAYWLPRFRKLGLPEDIATDYLDDIIRLVPGSYRRECPFENDLKTEAISYPKGSKDLLLLAKLAPHKEKWFEAIDKAIIRLQEALKIRSEKTA